MNNHEWDLTLSTYTSVSSDNKTIAIAGYRGISNQEIKSGKHYIEFRIDSYTQMMLGVIKSGSVSGDDSRVMFGYDGSKAYPRQNYGSSYNSSNIIGVMIDMDKGELSFTKDGINLGVAFYDLKTLGSVRLYVASTTLGGKETVTIVDDLEKMKYKEVALKFLLERRLVLKNPTTNQHYSLAEKTLISLPDTSTKNMILYGIEQGKEIQLDVPFDKIKTVIDNGDGTQTIVEETVTPFSIYDYISDTPEILVYTETTDDIIVSTTTEPFDIYDEFGDEVEVLFYTDDEAATEANLTLEANWSPIDELEGDFEVVTWTDEPQETAQKVLKMTAVPKPQFIKLVNPKHIYGSLNDVLVNDVSKSYRDEARYFVSGDDTTKWKVWDKTQGGFVITDASTHELITKNGMTHKELNEITDSQWRTWKEQYLNIGIFLKDNPRDTIVSVVENISYEDYLPRDTSTISDTSFYILNTTAKIDISLDGLTLNGTLSDDDLTRVQYRVKLNGQPYYPIDGNFTSLSPSPTSIQLELKSTDIKINDWNDLEVEFQDFFGTTDSWQVQFIGKYAGLMFKDANGDYYSTDLGQVLQYLDFGTILTGQTTIEHEIVLKNEYGYTVKDVRLFANTSGFADGLVVEFSEDAMQDWNNDLTIAQPLDDNDEVKFNIRMRSNIQTEPNHNNTFDIYVTAKKDE